MFLRMTLLLCVVELLLSSCMRRSPLLVPDQAKLIKKDDKALKPYAKPVQEKIQSAGTSSALVVTQREGSAPPAILPADDAIIATKANLDVVTSGGNCFLVFKSDLAMAPVQLNCATLSLRAKEAIALQAHDDQQDATMNALRGDLTALRQQLEALTESVQQTLKTHDAALRSHEATLGSHDATLKAHEVAITAARTDIDKLAAVLAPTTNMVAFHEKQLKQIEGMLNNVGRRYQKTAEVVGANNKQIESIINDMNTAFAQVRQTLEQMQQKLDTIK